MRCPVCRADNAEGPQCRRCKADLALLFTLEKQRETALALAGHALASGKSTDVLSHATTAHELRRGPDSWKALSLGHLLQGDYAAALHCHTVARHIPAR